jgi:hypothetical protein
MMIDACEKWWEMGKTGSVNVYNTKRVGEEEEKDAVMDR